ncbi:MAG: CHAT domain-containing protein, partial [Chloroflexi bacterium]|nr:CHAT domain-containing protein [Chloroflexota bacterium]
MPPRPPRPLVKSLREGRCALFAGSGLSAWASLPTWPRLLTDIAAEMRADEPDQPELQELDTLIKEGKLLEVADYCKEKLGPARYSGILAERLSGASGDIPEPHQLLMQLPFAAFVTTNYDKLLERAYSQVRGSLPKTPTHADIGALGPLLFTHTPFVLKAHGDIDRPETLILTQRDYQEMIHVNRAFNEVFSAILLTNAILFVGYSLSDPDLRLLLDRQLSIFKDYVPNRYALMCGISAVERDVLWRTARIQVLSYPAGQHQEVVEFLRTLKEEVEQAPAEELPLPSKIPEAPAVGVAQPISLPSTTLSIRLRGRDVESAVVTRERTVIAQGTAPLPEWSTLTRLLRDSEHGGLQIAPPMQRVGQALAGCFPAGVLRALQDIPPQHVLTLRLCEELETLPWEWVEVQGQTLFLRYPVVRASIGIADAARGFPSIRQPVQALLVGDPSDSYPLPGARAEIEAIAAVYGPASCTVLLGPQASFEAFVKSCLTGDFDVIHFAGHAWYDAQQAYLMLHDEVILRASEFQQLLSRRPPAILFLNSHYTA